MFKTLSLFALASLAIAAAPAPAPMAPPEAIAAATAGGRRGVRGLFVLQVASVGRGGRRVFLNSEPDYRHRDNLSIELLPSIAQALAAQGGGADAQALRGRRIEARGIVRRVPVSISDYGRHVGIYYQTRIVITDPDDIRLVG
jgi:hypothetical protein